jgi:hypothetical protein
MKSSSIAATAAVVLGSLTLTACVPPGVACPAIGFVYTAPIVIEMSADLIGDGTLAACLGESCEPAAIAPVEPGKWEVPQEPPYAPEDTIGLDAGAGIRIVVIDASGTTIRDDWFEIPFARSSDGPCPGPGEFLPVVVT